MSRTKGAREVRGWELLRYGDNNPIQSQSQQEKCWISLVARGGLTCVQFLFHTNLFTPQGSTDAGFAAQSLT